MGASFHIQFDLLDTFKLSPLTYPLVCGIVYWFQFSQMSRHSAKNRENGLKLQQSNNNTTIFRQKQKHVSIIVSHFYFTLSKRSSHHLSLQSVTCTNNGFLLHPELSATLLQLQFYTTEDYTSRLTAYDRKTTQTWNSSTDMLLY